MTTSKNAPAKVRRRKSDLGEAPVNSGGGCVGLFCERSLNRSKEPITPLRCRFDETGIVRIVSQRVSQSLYCCIQTVVEVYERAVRPQLAAQLFSGHQFARLLEQGGQ